MGHMRGVTALVVLAVAALSLTGCATPGPADDDVINVPTEVPTLAAAADVVQPGETILVAPGVYEETLLIDTPDVTIRGVDRGATVIEGGNVRPYGIVAIADGVRVENLTVRGATFYGVLFTGLHDENGPSAPTADGYTPWDPEDFPPLQRFLVDHVTATNNGLYGIYAFNAQHGVIRDSYASGSADSGFYVGQCRDCDILVSGNVAERNAVGFENANASDSVVVVGNRFSGNRVGMTLLSSYQEAFTPQRANRIIGNVIADNGEPGSPAQADGGFATGIGISGGADNVIARNLIAGHARAGVILGNTEDLPASGNRFDGNVFTGNLIDIANVSVARTPAIDNCAPDSLVTAPASLAAQLASACAATDGAAQDAVGGLAGPDAPPGLSFTKVALPVEQPNLMSPADDRGRLPDRVEMPDLSAIGVPDPSLLVSLTGSR